MAIKTIPLSRLETDLEKTLNLIDSFKRPEIRLMLKLQLLDGSELTSLPVSRTSSSPLPVLTRIKR